MEFKKEEYDLLTINVMKVPEDEDVLSYFPILNQYPEFQLELEVGLQDLRNEIIKYVVLVYDKKTPLKKIEDLKERKIRAALLAGFKPKLNKKIGRKYFPREIDHMLKGYNNEVTKMIVRYCRIQGNMLYSLLVAGQEGFYSSINDLMKRSPGEDSQDITKKQTVFREAKKNLDELQKIELEVLNEDSDIEIRKKLWEIIEEEDRKTWKITPERRLQQDEEDYEE